MKPPQLLLALALLPLGGCALFGLTNKVEVEHVLVELESGVKIRDTFSGQGPPVELGQKVTLDYTGYLSDGSIFDSSISRGLPITLVVGEAPLAGWNGGILGMRAGGHRHVWIPPELAYGAEGIEGLIPPDESLVFEFELLEIH
jgi:peptidylprolyl isomerase